MSRMFVRFSKRCGDSSKDKNKARSYRRAACIGDTYLVQDGADIVAYASCNKDNIYEVKVLYGANQEDYARYIKRFIGNSAKWVENEKPKRKYNVEFVKDFNAYQFSIAKKKVTNK